MARFAFENHYRVKELAVLWGLSPKTISRIFAEEPGVILVVNNGTTKRNYTTLSIPEGVASRVHDRLGNQALQESGPSIEAIRVIHLRDVEFAGSGNGPRIIRLKDSSKANGTLP
jgi:hypothetical protein